MQLTLEVISPNGEALGANRRKTVGPKGLKIGRAKEVNDWVIADRHISGISARIDCVNGVFFLENLGRSSVALNDPGDVIARNERQQLRSGDRFFLDQYEIRVMMQAALPLDDPFSTGDDPASMAVRRNEPSLGRLVDSASAETGTLDPLAVLGDTNSALRRPAASPSVEFNHGSALEEFYSPPAVSPIGESSEKIPHTWSGPRTSSNQAPGAGAHLQSGAKAPGIGAPRIGGIPDTWDKSQFTQLEAKVENSPVRAPAPAPVRQSQPSTVRRSSAAAKEQRTDVQRTQPVPAGAPPSGGAAISVGALGLEHLLRAAGMSAAQMTPEIAAEIGAALRVVVQGVMEVLQSRTEIKSQLGMSITKMKSTENNPLKFSPNVEAALHTLLVERNRGYLSTTAAFEEALLDIRNHQIAVLQGIRAGFDSLLENFDPEKIEQAMEGQSKRVGGLLNVGAKARFRDYYAEQFQRLTRDRDDSFRRLFGEPFAQAYEEQMEQLKSSTPRHSAGNSP